MAAPRAELGVWDLVFLDSGAPTGEAVHGITSDGALTAQFQRHYYRTAHDTTCDYADTETRDDLGPGFAGGFLVTCTCGSAMVVATPAKPAPPAGPPSLRRQLAQLPPPPPLRIDRDKPLTEQRLIHHHQHAARFHPRPRLSDFDLVGVCSASAWHLARLRAHPTPAQTQQRQLQTLQETAHLWKKG